jgi:aspartate kinase
MKIFKFGGASVKDAEGVKNVLNVLKHEGYKNTLIVISAMGKMTNAFEKIIDSYFYKTPNLEANINDVRDFHLGIVANLFEQKNHPIYTEIEQLFGKLSGFLITNKSTNYNFIYDQIVGYGELLSTKIVCAYLNRHNLNANWLDVRDYIITDANYRDAKINWEQTALETSKINTEKLYITQGFLGANSTSKTTSLGREGSDFSAAIFAYCLQAKSVTIWKDVPGVLNADPRYFQKTALLQQISYSEAIEMSFYGASVIHPKTLKPLENKNIPLYVRSFYNLTTKGTTVKKGQSLFPKIPCFILKKHQILIAIAALDFSFMVESNLSDIFKVLHNYKLKVNLIQNSALSFSVCIEDNYSNFDKFLNEMKQKYNINYTQNVSLYTIRHATKESVHEIEQKGKILLKQVTKGTVQLVMQ